ncbi:NAC domain-containing protein 53 [Hibiscus syriacus]|uniref:NAC domain-containing protein 53 n=2 Tax=Hibiscus syriacus TaxID=106335 RepID=A0A6A2WW75_HIBSY|nr:NAC domain-containing protein 53 [Hibiscus syriacus]
MGKNSWAPGFRFHPTDVELIMYYLKRKILCKKLSVNPIAEVEIYKYAPWDLPDKSCLKTGDLKWHFYCPMAKKYSRGDRVNRASAYGYWKATGKDRAVKYNDEVVGMIKTLVFHQGKAPRGDRTDWVMHEYRLEDKNLADRGVVQDSYMLYVVFKKDGMGPKNGAQYGAPFKEEEWSDDDDETNLPDTSSLCGTSTVAVGSASFFPESLCVGTTVDSNWVHPQPSFGHANDEVNCTAVTDADVYSSPTCVGFTSGVHPQPLVGHTNDEVNCTTVTDADAYTSPTCVVNTEAPTVAAADSVPALLEAPQLALVPKDQEPNDNNIVSMLDHFTEDDCQMIWNVTDSFTEAPQVCEEDDVLSMLEAFTDVDNSNNWCL